jgi:hypothetical protein
MEEEIHPRMQPIIKEFMDYIKSAINGGSVIDEGNSIVRECVSDALSAAGYDVDKPLNKRIILGFKIVAELDSNDDLAITVFNDVDKDKEITKTWETTDGGHGESSITIGEILDIMNVGREAFTIMGVNSQHGILAIPPKGQKYDPTNKANTRTRKANIPAMPAAEVFDIAKSAIREWSEQQTLKLLHDVENAVMDVIQESML